MLPHKTPLIITVDTLIARNASHTKQKPPFNGTIAPNWHIIRDQSVMFSYVNLTATFRFAWKIISGFAARYAYKCVYCFDSPWAKI